MYFFLSGYIRKSIEMRFHTHWFRSINIQITRSMQIHAIVRVQFSKKNGRIEKRFRKETLPFGLTFF